MNRVEDHPKYQSMTFHIVFAISTVSRLVTFQSRKNSCNHQQPNSTHSGTSVPTVAAGHASCSWWRPSWTAHGVWSSRMGQHWNTIRRFCGWWGNTLNYQVWKEWLGSTPKCLSQFQRLPNQLQLFKRYIGWWKWISRHESHVNPNLGGTNWLVDGGLWISNS